MSIYRECTIIDTVRDPTSVCFAKNGDVLVTSYEYHSLYVLDQAGRVKRIIGGHGVEELKFKGPKQVAFNEHDNSIYIMESMGKRIQVISAQQTFLSFFAYNNSTSWIKSFSPSAFCIGPNGYVYSTSLHTKSVEIYHSNGILLHQFNTNITRALTGIAIDSDSNIHVSSHSGVKVFNSQGDSLYEYCTDQWVTGISITNSGISLVISKGLIAVCMSNGSLQCEYRGNFYPHCVAICPDDSAWIASQEGIIVLPQLFLPPFDLSLLCHQSILKMVDEIPVHILPLVFNKVFTEWSHELKIDLPCHSSNVSGDIDDENYGTIDKLKLGCTWKMPQPLPSGELLTGGSDLPLVKEVLVKYTLPVLQNVLIRIM